MADYYTNEEPAYILGYPGGDFQKIKAANAFAEIMFRASFMVSHNIEGFNSMNLMSSVNKH